jgi:hypothetical protein
MFNYKLLTYSLIVSLFLHPTLHQQHHIKENHNNFTPRPPSLLFGVLRSILTIKLNISILRTQLNVNPSSRHCTSTNDILPILAPLVLLPLGMACFSIHCAILIPIGTFNLNFIARLVLDTAILPYLAKLILLSGDIELNPGPKLFSININSLRYKIDNLSAEIPLDIDILCITETRLDNTIKDHDILVPGFSEVFRKDLTIDSGGVCLQLSDNLIGTRLMQLEQNNLELLWVKVTYKTDFVVIGVGYRNPALPVKYWDVLYANVSNAVGIYGQQKIVLVGDFNQNLLNPKPCHLSNLIEALNMHQLVSEPTHFTSHSESLLDPVICGNANLITCVKVLPQGISNHCPVVINILQDIPKTNHKRSIWLFNRANWNGLKHETSNIQWNNILNENDLNTAVENFNTTLLRTCKKYIPHKRITFTPKDKEWITVDIKLEIDKRNKLFHRAKQSGSPQLFERYRQQRNYVTTIIRNAKRNHLVEITTKLTDCKQDKDWWKLTKSVCGLAKDSKVPSLKHNECAVSDPQSKAEILNSHFAEICCVDESNIPNRDNLPPLNVEELTSIPISEQDIADQITTLDPNKATGPDGICIRLIKSLKQQLINPLFILFSRSLNEHIFPFEWKKANLTPVFKKGDKHDKNNYTRALSYLNINLASWQTTQPLPNYWK